MPRPISPGEEPLALDPRDLEASGLFGVGVAGVHHLRRRKLALPRRLR
ncbi:MAG: hypothetical protein ACKO45_08145 [Cyanobium sp.]